MLANGGGAMVLVKAMVGGIERVGVGERLAVMLIEVMSVKVAVLVVAMRVVEAVVFLV